MWMAPKYQEEVSAWDTMENYHDDPLAMEGFSETVKPLNPKLDKKNMSKKNQMSSTFKQILN